MRHLAACFLVLAACAPSDDGATDVPAGDDDEAAERRSRTFTSSSDFAQGTVDGLTPDAAGQLQMSAGVNVYETPFIWIPNSAARTVTQIDTVTRQVLGTYPLAAGGGEDCYNPSRTTVDLEGNVWVGCRGEDSYINREDVTAGMVPVDVDHKVVKLAHDDGRVLLSIEVGHAPRALALDAQNRLWVGCSVDDTIWLLDGTTGACLRGEGPGCAAPAIEVDDFPYGSAVDQRGHLWVVHNRLGTQQPDLVAELDTATGNVLDVYGPYLREGCNSLYGIAIDQLNNVWLAGYGCNDVIKIKGASGVFPVDQVHYDAGDLIDVYDVGGDEPRGLAVDLDGNVWVALSGTNTATKLSNVSGEILATVNVGFVPTGVGIDAYGNAWVVNQDSDSVHHINGLNVSERQEIGIGDGPYTYSDMLGMALRTITHRAEGFSSWRVVIDSELEAPTWENINWTAVVPNNTTLRVRSRCAASEAGLATTGWSDFIDAPGPFSCGAGSGRYAEVEVRFSATGTTSSPVLNDLSVTWH